MGYDPFSKKRPSSEFLGSQRMGGQAATRKFGDATVGADISGEDYGFDETPPQQDRYDQGNNYDPFGGHKASDLVYRGPFGNEPTGQDFTPSAPKPAPPPVFEQNEPIQTSAFNLLKRGTGFISDQLGKLAAPETPGFIKKAAEGAGFFPSLVTGAIGLTAKDRSPATKAAYEANFKTLGGDAPGAFDIAATARAGNAAREVRADEARQVAESEQSSPLERLKGAAAQALYGAAPNVAPVGILPRGSFSGATRLAGKVAPEVAGRVSRALTPVERPAAAGMSRLYRAEAADTGLGPIKEWGTPGTDGAAYVDKTAAANPTGRYFTPDKGSAEIYQDILHDTLYGTGRKTRLTSLDLPKAEADKYSLLSKFPEDNDTGAVLPESLVPGDVASRRRNIPMERPITTALKKFLSDEYGGLDLSKFTPAQRKAMEDFASIEGVQKVGDEVPAAAPTVEAATPHHLDATKVGEDVARRNQVVHNAHVSLIEAVKKYQAGDTSQEAVIADHLSTLKSNGVKDASTLAKLKQAGIQGLPGTRTATARLAAARVKATETPSMAAQRELAAARGVDPEAAIKGATQPASTAAMLRQQLQGKTEGPLSIPVKKSLGAQMAERAAILRGGDQPRSLRFGMDQEAPLAVPTAPKGPLAPEGPKGLPLKPDTISLMKPTNPITNMPEAPRPPAPAESIAEQINKGKDLSYKEIRQQFSDKNAIDTTARPLQDAGAPPPGSLRASGAGKFQVQSNVVVNTATGNVVRRAADAPAAQLVADQMNAKGYKAPGITAPDINPKLGGNVGSVQGQLVKPLPAKPTEVLKPAQAGQLKTRVQPLVTTTGPKVGTKVAGGVVAQRASATASAAVKRKVGTPAAPAAVAPPKSPPPPPIQSAPAVAAPAPAVGATSSKVPAPSQPLVGPVAQRSAAVTTRIAQGAPAKAGKAKVAPTPGQLTIKQNMTNLQWEVKQSNGTIIGSGASRAQAVKAGQAYLAANPPVGGGAGGGKPPTATGGGPTPPAGAKPPVTNIITDIANTPRTLETTGDVSYTLRQGFILAAGHPIAAAKAFKTQMEYLYNSLKREGDQFANTHMQKLQAEAEWKRTQDLGLETTSWDAKLGPLEEGFLASRLTKAPIIKQSNIAAVLFLNDLRYSVAKQTLKGAKNASDAQLTAVMHFINAASGRGNLPKWLNTHAPTLNGFLYSPKFQWSRAEVVASLPKAAITRNPYLAKEAARDVVASFITGKMITELARMNGAKVVDDDTSPDWGKIQVGNTRLDIWGGFQPIGRYINQIAEGKRTTIDGQVIFLDRASGMPINEEKSQFSQLLDKYRPNSSVADFFSKSIHGKFIRSKLSPLAGLGMDAFLGKDYAGAPFDAGREAQRMVTPLGWQDIYEAIADDVANGGSGVRGAATGALSLLGAGAQTIPSGNKQYPMLPEAALRLVAGGGKSLFEPSGTTFPTTTPKPTATPKAKKTATPGTYNPFGR